MFKQCGSELEMSASKSETLDSGSSASKRISGIDRADLDRGTFTPARTNRKARRRAKAEKRATLAAARADLRRRVADGHCTAHEARQLMALLERVYAGKYGPIAARVAGTTKPATAGSSGSIPRVEQQQTAGAESTARGVLEVPGAGRSLDQTATVAPASGPSGPP